MNWIWKGDYDPQNDDVDFYMDPLFKRCGIQNPVVQPSCELQLCVDKSRSIH